jgi:hypothetical protein
MSKKKCEKDDNKVPEEPKYRCKKCNRLATKEKKLCKPKEI